MVLVVLLENAASDGGQELFPVWYHWDSLL